jgi:hypothetical protein
MTYVFDDFIFAAVITLVSTVMSGTMNGVADPAACSKLCASVSQTLSYSNILLTSAFNQSRLSFIFRLTKHCLTTMLRKIRMEAAFLTSGKISIPNFNLNI